MKKIIASGLLSLSLLFSTVTVLTPEVFAAKVPNPVQRYGGNRYDIKQGNVTAINGTSLTVTLLDINEQPNGKTITVNTDSSTKFKRRFWGDSSISEISVGDRVNVKGTWTDSSQTTLQAKYVRDTSIMKKFGTFIGTVLTKSDTSFTFDPNHRGNQTVYFDSNTKFINRSGQTMTYSQLNVGDKVRVKGIWDKTLHKITGVTEVKDFGPAGSTATTNPSASASPSASPH